MKQSLTNLFSRKKQLTAILEQASMAIRGAWCIENLEGQLLWGAECPAGAPTHAIQVEQDIVGWVKGQGPGAGFVAAMLNQWLRQETEKKQLGAEALHLYREINLLFSLAEKLSDALHPEAIAELTLRETRQIIAFEWGAVMFVAEKTGQIEMLAQTSAEFPNQVNTEWLLHAAKSGRSEICPHPADATRMALCATLKLGQRVLGSILLTGASFSAADLKLLSTLATQTAAALEQSVRYQQATAEALKAQREQLTLELALKKPFFKKLMAVAETHYADPDFSVGHLADALHLSVSQLQRKISAMTNLTPVQIIRDLRLRRAKELLQSTDLTVAEVAYQAGFNDPSYFTRLFVRELNCTPSAWKEMPQSSEHMR